VKIIFENKRFSNYFGERSNKQPIRNKQIFDFSGKSYGILSKNLNRSSDTFQIEKFKE
jgi:hypothetical protein